MDIFIRTKQLAELQGLSLSQLALKAGLSEKTLYRWRTGNPKFETIEQVANALNVPTNVLLHDTPDEQLLTFETEVATEPFDLSDPHKIRWAEFQRVEVTGDSSYDLNDDVVTIEYLRAPAGLRVKKGDNQWRVFSAVKVPYGYMDQTESDFVQEKYRDFQIASFEGIKKEIQKRLGKPGTTKQVMDLGLISQSSNRNDVVKVNHQVISDDDWDKITEIIKKYMD